MKKLWKWLINKYYKWKWGRFYKKVVRKAAKNMADQIDEIVLKEIIEDINYEKDQI